MFNNRFQSTDFIIIWISNLGDIAAAFGPETHLQCISVVRQRLIDGGLPAVAIELQDEVVTIDLSMLPTNVLSEVTHVENYSTDRQEDKLAQFLFAIVGAECIDTIQGQVYLRVEVKFLRFNGTQYGFTDRSSFLAEQSTRRPALVPGILTAWCQRFRSDMKHAANLLNGLRNGSLILVFQPIVHFINGETVCIYSEALLRHIAEPTYAPEDAINALERLKLISHLDYSVVSTILQLLRYQPNQHIAANISAVSLNNNAFWHHLIEQLEEMPDIASRLILEITETAEISKISDAIRLLGLLKKTGVRIALDDVGTGMTTLEFIAIAHADIIKIDRSVLQRSSISCSGVESSELANLVCLCKNYAGLVVVEGIETSEQLNQAIGPARANGVQGYLISRPEVQAGWMKTAPCHVVDVYNQFLSSQLEVILRN